MKYVDDKNVPNTKVPNARYPYWLVANNKTLLANNKSNRVFLHLVLAMCDGGGGGWLVVPPPCVFHFSIYKRRKETHTSKVAGVFFQRIPSQRNDRPQPTCMHTGGRTWRIP